MHARRFFPILATVGILLLVSIVAGCSGGNPAAPDAGPITATVPRVASDPGNHYCWGEFLLTFSDVTDAEGNVTDVEIDVEPLRSSEVHVDVTAFTKPPYCGGPGCMRVQAVGYEPGYPFSQITATVFLTNPSQNLTGYDVRGIIQPPPSVVRLLNHDGLTMLHTYDVPVMAYPYKAFNVDEVTPEHRPFRGSEEHAASYVFEKHNDYPLLTMPYKIDVSFPVNAREAVGCYIQPFSEDDLFYPEGSDAWVIAVITDWQEMEEDIEWVRLDLSEFGEYVPQDMIKIEESGYTSSWMYPVTQGGGYPDGERTIRLTAHDSVEPYEYYYDITVTVVHDLEGPRWVDEQKQGIYDHISGPSELFVFYGEATDPSLPIEYIFHASNSPDPFSDGNKLKVITSVQYQGYTSFGPVGAPSNVLRWFGIELKDAQGNTGDYDLVCDYSLTRFSQDARWSRKDGQPAGQDGIFGSPAIGDVNGDGQNDIVVGTRDKKVYVYGGDGTGTEDTRIWTYATGGEIQCTPALVDLNGDGKLEVVVASDDMNVYAINGATGLPYWNVDVGDDFLMHGSASIAQLNGGAYDVIIGTGEGNLLALNGEDGSEIWTFPTGGGIAGTPAVSDVTGDGTPDVCFGSYDQHVYMVNGQTGLEVWSYYIAPGMFNVDCSPVLVDLNDDTVPDCVIGARDNISGPSGAVYALDGTSGAEIWYYGDVWGNARRGPAPAPDIDGDGCPEILVCAYQTEVYSIYVISGATGETIYAMVPPPGVDPDEPFNYTSPIVGDFTGDGHANVLYGRMDGWCDLRNLGDLDYPGGFGGRLLESIQVSIGSKLEIYGTPAIEDVDGDGELELIAANMRGYVYIRDLHAPVPDDVDLRMWTQHSGNRWHTGTPGFVPPD